jgi:SAM-dependent methyltransferase
VPDPASQPARARDAWNLAAPGLDHPIVDFWIHFGAGLVERAGLRPGMRVLDACAGAGASSIPACRAVGPGGAVLAVDVSDRSLALARARAESAGLDNLETRAADMSDLDLPDNAFDAVLCGFAIFFLPDMDASLARLWRLVAPDGVLALTTWRKDFWRPLRTILHEELKALRPDLLTGASPWERVRDEAGVRALFDRVGVPGVEVEIEQRRQRVPTPEDAWALALGTGYRWNLEQMAPGEIETLRSRVVERVRDEGVADFDTTAIYAVVRKPR